MARPCLAFLTDFGTRDHYVGTMKGVALGICPDATLVDITHDIAPQDVVGGALELAASFRYFPSGTVFVAVVDPGVGSSRRALAAAAGGFRFVAPDNGLLSCVFDEVAPARVVELSEPRFARPTISRTFEGRDRFAPAAAWLAHGTEISDLGPPAASWCRIDIPRPSAAGGALQGEVLRVDRFGNAVTNIDRATLEQFAAGRRVAVTAGDHDVGPLRATYADAPPHGACALFSSTDHLEVAVNGGSAADALGLQRGTLVICRVS